MYIKGNNHIQLFFRFVRYLTKKVIHKAADCFLLALFVLALSLATKSLLFSFGLRLLFLQLLLKLRRHDRDNVAGLFIFCRYCLSASPTAGCS